MQQQIGMCIQDITAPLLQRCSQLVAAGQDTDKQTDEILEDAHNFVAQLADIYDYVSPCFPEKYKIFHVIWKQYHEHLAFMLDCVGACAEQLANADILKVRLPSLLPPAASEMQFYLERMLCSCHGVHCKLTYSTLDRHMDIVGPAAPHISLSPPQCGLLTEFAENLLHRLQFLY